MTARTKLVRDPKTKGVFEELKAGMRAVVTLGDGDQARLTGRVTDTSGAALPGATVSVASAKQSKPIVVVTDNGPGVPPADRDKLFMPYYSTKGRGSGLGLAIVRRILVQHGGGIEVSAARPSGTTFTIELPCLPS